MPTDRFKPIDLKDDANYYRIVYQSKSKISFVLVERYQDRNLDFVCLAKFRTPESAHKAAEAIAQQYDYLTYNRPDRYLPILPLPDHVKHLEDH